MKRSWIKWAFYEFVRVLTGTACWLFFRLQVVGKEQYPEQRGGLICANHQSFLDPILVGLSCPRQMSYLARRSLWDSTVLGWLIDLLEAIPIERDGIGIGGLKATLRRLKQDELVLMFPEGTRSPDGTLQPIHPGLVAVARRSNQPLIPVGLEGAFEAWPREAKYPRSGRICVVVGKPLMPEDFLDLTDDDLLSQLADRIRECVEIAGSRLPTRCRAPSSTPTSSS